MTRATLRRPLLAFLLLAAAVAAAREPAPAPRVRDLSPSGEELRAQFNAEADRVRLVLLLAPA